MSTLHLAIFLLAYAACSTAISLVLLALPGRRRTGLMLLPIGLASVMLATWLGTQLGEGSFIDGTATALAALSRKESTAFGLGVFCALPLGLLVAGARGGSAALLALLGASGTVAVGALVSGQQFLSPYLPNPDSEFRSAGFGSLVDPAFRLEPFIDTDLIPIRISVSPAGRIYVSGHRGIAAQEGAVVELEEQGDGSVSERMVARMLNRPYGLVATDEALYVSRSGQHTKWRDGTAEQISTGAVTRLEDLDGDGIMDLYDDVISDLPGAKGPDYLHQNNGIALGEDGALYVTTANHTDGHPVADPLAGAILRASGPDFDDVQVFASGLRNPFGLAFDGDGNLFATDNDPQSGALGNLGDKLLLVEGGEFFGHPYAAEGVSGVADPLLRSTYSLGGLAHASSELLPAPYRNAMYVVIFGEGRIARVVPEAGGEVTLAPFATVPGAVDIAAAPNGDFYVAVYPDRVVRLRYAGESS